MSGAAPSIAGVILVGGRSSRFEGGSKERAILAGKPLLDHVIARAAPQVDVLTLSIAKGAPSHHRGLVEVEDVIADCGPLGGLHAALGHAARLTPRVDFLASFACDTPEFPRDLVARLHAAILAANAPAAAVSRAGRLQPTFALWRTDHEAAARQRLEGANRSLTGFAQSIGAVSVPFDDYPEAAFFNVNTREDLERLADQFPDSNDV